MLIIIIRVCLGVKFSVLFSCSLEEDFVRWRESFWPAVLSKYNIDIREIKRHVLLITVLFSSTALGHTYYVVLSCYC